MLLAALEYVSKSFATQVVLDGADFRISTGQKVALVGPNGSGKTTILRMLLGQEEISGGAVFLSKRARVGYVPQFLDYDGEVTVLDHVQAEHETALRRLREAEEALEASGSTLPPIPSSSGEETTEETDAEAEEREARPLSDADKLLKNYMRAREDYDRLEGDFYSQRARGMLEALAAQASGGLE